jgi:hypothetical protein
MEKIMTPSAPKKVIIAFSDEDLEKQMADYRHQYPDAPKPLLIRIEFVEAKNGKPAN